MKGEYELQRNALVLLLILSLSLLTVAVVNRQEAPEESTRKSNWS